MVRPLPPEFKVVIAVVILLSGGLIALRFPAEHVPADQAVSSETVHVALFGNSREIENRPEKSLPPTQDSGSAQPSAPKTTVETKKLPGTETRAELSVPVESSIPSRLFVPSQVSISPQNPDVSPKVLQESQSVAATTEVEPKYGAAAVVAEPSKSIYEPFQTKQTASMKTTNPEFQFKPAVPPAIELAELVQPARPSSLPASLPPALLPPSVSPCHAPLPTVTVALPTTPIQDSVSPMDSSGKTQAIPVSAVHSTMRPAQTTLPTSSSVVSAQGSAKINMETPQGFQ